MIRDKRVRPEVDRLLEQAFPDDLPADAEARLASQIDRFEESWVRRGRKEAAASIRPRRWMPAMTRVSLAAVSVLIIILGLRLRGSTSLAGLGSTLASLQWEAFYSARIADFQSMECAVHLDKPEEPMQEFVIQWMSPEETRVRLIKGGNETVRTFYPLNPERSVLELLVKSRPAKTSGQAKLEAELRPVEGLLSSAHLRELLEGRWQPAGTERRDGCDWRSFSVSKPPEASASMVTVDSCTSLPVRLEKDLGRGERIEAHFHWIPRAEPGGSLFLRRLLRSAEEMKS